MRRWDGAGRKGSLRTLPTTHSKLIAVVKALALKYSGGERYPNLAREPGTPDLLAQIAQPRAASSALRP